MSESYVCRSCGKEYDKGWSEPEAVAEYEAQFGEKPNAARDVIVCDDCHKLMTVWMETRKMTRLQLLDWLGKEDSSAYGECKGPLLDQLLADGLVFVIPDPAPSRGRDYDRVSLTEAGWEELVKSAK